MLKWMLAAGAAALAITAPTAAQPGGGKGKQKGEAAQVKKSDRGGGRQARSPRGGDDRQVRAQRGGGDKQVHAQRGGSARQVRVERGGGDRARSRQQFVQSDGRRGRGGNDRMRTVRVDDNRSRGDNRIREVRADNDRGRGRGQDGVQFDRGRDRDFARFDRDGDNGVIRVKDRDRFVENRVFKVRDFDDGRIRFRDVDRDDLYFRRLGYGVGGCPPGLAKKNNGCLPPGQAARFIGQPLLAATRFGTLAPLPGSFNNLFWDDDDYYYRWGGGYLYRVDRDRDLIDGLFPLFGAALIGQPLNPYYVNSYYQPPYYSSFYPNSPYDCYQYGYAYVYETDCRTGLVEDVIPTYAYGYGVGQIMPPSYSYYNVPYAYRSYFVDNDDYYYRYAPGAIYQVDRGTALISAVAALLTGGLSVGQPLPVGYSAYNVPLAYRSTYYDTPDIWYRYDNGYIYGIDPRTRMVNNVAYVIV